MTLASWATATARLDIGDSGALCQPVTAAGLRVYPPGQRAAKIVPIPFGTCPYAARYGWVWGPVQGSKSGCGPGIWVMGGVITVRSG